jgi:hypothetical protein
MKVRMPVQSAFMRIDMNRSDTNVIRLPTNIRHRCGEPRERTAGTRARWRLFRDCEPEVVSGSSEGFGRASAKRVAMRPLRLQAPYGQDNPDGIVRRETGMEPAL